MSEIFAAFIPLLVMVTLVGGMAYLAIRKIKKQKAEVDTLVKRHYPTSSSFCCPVCQSDNVAKVSLVVAHGTKSFSSSTVGLGYAGSVGVGGAQTTGSSQSAAAQSLSPPEPVGIGVALFAVVVGIFFVTHDAQIVGTVVLIMAAISLFRAYTFNRRVLPVLLKTWDELYLCQRCANLFKIKA